MLFCAEAALTSMTKKYTGGWGGRTWKERYGKMGDGGEDEGGRGGGEEGDGGWGG